MSSAQQIYIVASEDRIIDRPEIKIVPTTSEHLRVLAETLRPEDRQEILAFGITPERALWRCYRSSLFSKTGLIDGEVAAIWGVNGAFLGDIGAPWLLTSPAVKKISPLKFCRIYQKEALYMLELFTELSSIVDANYSAAIRLLEVIGFNLKEPKPMGSKGRLFREFWRVK